MGIVDTETRSHTGHVVIVASGKVPAGERAAWRICVDCSEIVTPVVFCLAPTKQGSPCQITIRPDLGYTHCPAHREAV